MSARPFQWFSAFIALTAGLVACMQAPSPSASGPAASGAHTLSVPVSGVYKILSACDPSKGLDVKDQRSDDTAPLQLYSYWGGQNQQFLIRDAGGGLVTIAPQHAPGEVLDVQGGATANGTPVWQYHLNGTDAQLWKLTAVGNGEYQLRPQNAPDKLLDLNMARPDDGNTIQLWQPSNSCAQRWKLEALSGPLNPLNIAEYNRMLGRGINFDDALGSPGWDTAAQETYFQAVKDAGFSTVRLPINWPQHTAPDAPYAIDPAFMARVDWEVGQATARGLHLILDFHGYDELIQDPSSHVARFLGIWRQVAEHFKDQPNLVSYEVLNEPNGYFNDHPDVWNDVQARAVAVIRASNPTRPIIVGPMGWNGAWALGQLTLPDDPNLIVTLHDYTPLQFTHQGAEWDSEAAAWLGTTWTGTAAERQQITDELDGAAQWAQQHHRPVFVGEFGSYHQADLASRVRWTTFMRSAFEARGFSWAYWEFGSGFGAYDREAGQWRAPLLQALMP